MGAPRRAVCSIDVLAELERGRPGALALVGEPGIGKTRLLAELAARADARGCLVLGGSASELERDLPFWVFVDALDEYVEGLPPRRLDALDDGRAQRARAGLPLAVSVRGSAAELRFSTSAIARTAPCASCWSASRSTTPLVLVLDDLHWADPGSVELLGALLRRPPAAAVLVAMGVRPRQAPERRHRRARAGAARREHWSASRSAL